ncbi:MAG: thioredoxin domain-containing protein [Polyangiaceae bacterium]|nr:thioredoxin domain-containing protein [Polyangiaceae bacterium]
MQNRSSWFWYVLSFAGGMFLMWAIGKSSSSGASATAESAAPSASAPTADATGPLSATSVNEGAVKVELFVMSQCPYGVQAEAAFKDIVAKFGADIDFKLEFIGTKDPKGAPKSMHGPAEVKGDIVQVCAMKYAPNWFDMVLCQNKDYKSVDTNWQACAQEAGIATDKIDACVNGKEGEELLVASFDRADKLGVQGSPTIRIAGKEYDGSRRPADMMRAICAEYTGSKPAVCNEIPESPKVNVTILSDTRCEECDAKGVERVVKARIANPVVTVLDYAEPAGKKLYGEIGPAKLPALIFDATLDKDPETLSMVEPALRKAGDHKVFEMGDAWIPTCHDDGGCSRDECKDTMECKLAARTEMPKRLDLFIMSQCPFGVKATDAMLEVLDNFKKNGEKIDFAIHYIGNGDEKSGFNSMHGQTEVDEDIRHLCAIEHYKKDFKFLDYIWCRNKNWKGNDWESCVGPSTGIEKSVIEKCANSDEGKKLLEKSFATTNEIGFGASPTWMVNNKFQFSGIDPETIKTNFCKYNKLAGCDTKLTGMQAPAAPGAPEPGCGG